MMTKAQLTKRSRQMVTDQDYGTWVPRRAEQLAIREQPAEFARLYTARALAMGTDGYAEAVFAFDNFFAPYIGHAKRHFLAESHAAQWHQSKNGKWQA